MGLDNHPGCRTARGTSCRTARNMRVLSRRFILCIAVCIVRTTQVGGKDQPWSSCSRCSWFPESIGSGASESLLHTCLGLSRLRGSGTVQGENNSRESTGRTRGGRRQRLTRGERRDEGGEGGVREPLGGVLPGTELSGREFMDNAAAWGVSRDTQGEELAFHRQESSTGEIDEQGGREWVSSEAGGTAEQRGEPLSNEAACTLMASQREDGREGRAMEHGGEGGHVGVSFSLLAPTERYAGKTFGGVRKGRHSWDRDRTLGLMSGQSDAGGGGGGGGRFASINMESEERGQQMVEAEREREKQAKIRRQKAWDRVMSSGPMGPNDTVPFMTERLRELLDIVTTHPSLEGGSASFMRDYLRTLIHQSSEGIGGEEDGGVSWAGGAGAGAGVGVGAGAGAGAGKIGAWEGEAGGEEGGEDEIDMFDLLPDETVHQILGHLDGPNLAKVMHISERFARIGGDDFLWQERCLSLWPSLRHDTSAQALLEGQDNHGQPFRQGSSSRWRELYPSLALIPSWPCTLIKSGRAMCNMLVHNVAGLRLAPESLSASLVLERRFPISQLPDFVAMEGAAILYFEPETPEDRPGYDALIEYLLSRDRVGLGVEADRRIMYIPPCEFTRTNLSYTGNALMGIVQKAGLSPMQ